MSEILDKILVLLRDLFTNQVLFSVDLKDGFRLQFLFFDALFLQLSSLLLNIESKTDGGEGGGVWIRFFIEFSISCFSALAAY